MKHFLWSSHGLILRCRYYIHSFMVGGKTHDKFKLIFLFGTCMCLRWNLNYSPPTDMYISIFIYFFFLRMYLSCLKFIYMYVYLPLLSHPILDAGARHDESTKFGKTHRFQQSQRGRQRGRKERNRKSFLKKTRRTFLRSHPQKLG